MISICCVGFAELFNVCSTVTVECFLPVLRGYCCYVRKKALLQCFVDYREEGYWHV